MNTDDAAESSGEGKDTGDDFGVDFLFEVTECDIFMVSADGFIAMGLGDCLI